MSQFRPECVTSTEAAMSDDTALYLIRDSVNRRRTLIHGRLDNGSGGHCALGCFWADNPKVALKSSLIDEVAAVNDSLPKSATPQQRWKQVQGWLRFKIKSLPARKP